MLKKENKNKSGTVLNQRNTSAQARGTALSHVRSRKVEKKRRDRRPIGRTPVTIRDPQVERRLKAVHLGIELIGVKVSGVPSVDHRLKHRFRREATGHCEGLAFHQRFAGQDWRIGGVTPVKSTSA
ncbi:hypothetical protein HAX54_005689 [Datura stramonium]|uniref:Uncharacterized protein n=1 Tax=Datura stramonium TaxID=4076 RepID=A0ABS8TAE5_DATST|nr:hypothetical protein [Datura stramonium]